MVHLTGFAVKWLFKRCFQTRFWLFQYVHPAVCLVRLNQIFALCSHSIYIYIFWSLVLTLARRHHSCVWLFKADIKWCKQWFALLNFNCANQNCFFYAGTRKRARKREKEWGGERAEQYYHYYYYYYRLFRCNPVSVNQFHEIVEN